jgi:hypothetical protein
VDFPFQAATLKLIAAVGIIESSGFKFSLEVNLDCLQKNIKEHSREAGS